MTFSSQEVIKAPSNGSLRPNRSPTKSANSKQMEKNMKWCCVLRISSKWEMHKKHETKNWLFNNTLKNTFTLVQLKAKTMIVNQDSGDSGLLLAVSSLPKRSRMHRKTKVESCSFIPLLKILWTLHLSNLSFFKPLPLHHSHQGRNFAHFNIRKEFKILSFTKTISGASTAETFQKSLEPLEPRNSHWNLFQTFL